MARGLYNAGIDLPLPLYKLTNSVVYSFHMPLFFFLSGLFFYNSLSKRGGGQLVFSKIDTVFYPYVVWSILQGSIEAFLSNYVNGNVSFFEVFSLLWAPRAQFWFLYALFFVFAVSAVVYSIIQKKYSFLVFLLAASLYLSPSILPDLKISVYLSNNLVFFTFGIIFTMYVKIERFSSTLSLVGLFFAFIFGQWLFHSFLSLKYIDRGIESLLLALISIIFVVSCSVHLAKRSYSFIAFIGTSSMGIYLMHILAGSGVRVVINKFGISSFGVHIILGCLVGILVPLVALIIIKRLKIPYIFSAPISIWMVTAYNKVLQRTSR